MVIGTREEIKHFNNSHKKEILTDRGFKIYEIEYSFIIDKEELMNNLNDIPKIPNILNTINFDIYKYIKTEIDSKQEDNILFQIEKNQQEEIVKLKELNEKKDAEILALKINVKKDRKRFWWTYSITTFLAIVGIILGIIF